jgi:nucleotide-binding universal stress UspA family protein
MCLFKCSITIYLYALDAVGMEIKMKDFSMLIAVNGSEQSLQASRLAFLIARKLKAKIIAQHVIDSRTAWSFMGHDKPGLLERMLYQSAYLEICTVLRGLAKELMIRFSTLLHNEQLEAQCLVTEGNPIHELSRTASDCDLVVVGHQPSNLRSIDSERSQFIRTSVAESLAHECERPLLVVQSAPAPLTALKVLVSLDHVNVAYIRACYSVARMLGLDIQIVFLASGTHEETPRNFIRDMRLAYPDLVDVPISVMVLKNANSGSVSLWTHTPIPVELEGAADELVVIPTREIGAKRITIFGSSPDMFIRHLQLPTILIWPEECSSELNFASQAEGAQLSARSPKG